MARETRRKSRVKKSFPQRRAASTGASYRRELSLKERGEELKSWKVALLLTGIFLLALFLRTYFNVSEATDNGFKMTGGSDPYYHKRAVDWVIHKHEHLGFDPMLNYPIGIPNPRPPVFDWSLALTGIIVSPFFGGNVDRATWWATEFMPALWGALIVIPVYLIGRESFNKRTGLIGAFFISLMPGHIGHTTFALADHDAFIMFFVAVAIYYFQRAVNTLRDGEFVKDWTDLREIRRGFAQMARENNIALGYALMAGMAMSTIGLAWKGFPYIMTIILGYFVFQLFINKLRNVDSLNLSFITLVSLSLPLILTAPYYTYFGFVSWWTPPLYMFIAVAVAAVFFVPTRRVPWLLIFITIFALGGVSYVLLKYVFKDFGSLVLGGAQYFVRSKLFNTIAEAQPPTFSRIVFSYGLITFFLAFFIGVPYAGYRAFKSKRKDMMFMLVWAVISAYMAASAVRFIFNGTPIMALLAAWIMVDIFDWLDFRKMVKDIRGYSSRGESVADRFKAVYRGTGLRHVLGAILIVIIILPNAFNGLDAGIPYEDKKEWDNKIYNALDDHHMGFLLPSNDTFDPNSNNLWFLGAFGPSFPNGYWLSYFNWLKQQDNTTPPEDRPAFLSWWDYGFWAIQLGEHPTVADNFQTGYQFAGNFIAAEGENESVALMIQRLLDANIRAHNRHYGPEVSDILDRYMNQTAKDRLYYIYTHSVEFKTKNVSAENGRIRAMKDVLTGNLSLEKLVDLYHDLRVATGYSIRYFAIDSRLFPFSPTNNIFYAPVTLADLDVGTFLETLYIPGDKDGNPTGERLTAEEAKKRAELDKKFRIVDTDLRYKKAFFDTMLYKTFVGWYGEDINMSINDGIPGVRGKLQNYNIMPGWMMKHYREVYRTFYWNPYPPDEVKDHNDAWQPMTYLEAVKRGGTQGNISSGLRSGVVSLKYYDGAIVSGRVVTDKGMPVPGARVTVIDENGVPHDTSITDEWGNYRLIAPFGKVAIATSMGSLSKAQNKLLQMGDNVLNTTSLYVPDDQAMRVVDYNISKDIVVPSGAINGKVYWDENNDGKYQPDTDTFIQNPHIVLQETLTREYYNLTQGNEEWYGVYYPENGSYFYHGLPPGEYSLSLMMGEHSRVIKMFTKDASLYPAKGKRTIDTRQQDIAVPPASISGVITFANGTRITQKVKLIDRLDGSEREATAIDGRFLFTYLMNGSYDLKVEGTNIFQPHMKPVEAIEGGVEGTNITLYPAVRVTGRTYYDFAVRKNITVYFNSTIPGLSTTAVSDKNGNFSATVAAATYDITASEYIRSIYHAAYKREPFSAPTQIIMNMENTHRLTGVVFYDLNGNNSYDKNAINREEVPNAYVTLSGPGFVLSDKANGRGEYNFRVPSGRYTLEAIDNDTQRTTFDEITLTRDMSLNLQLGSAHTVEGKVTHSGWRGQYGNNSVAGAVLDLNDGERKYTAATDADGYYRLYLPDGNYTVTVSGFGLEKETEHITVLANVSRDFTLAPLDITVKGTIRFNGQPLSNAEVKFDDTHTAISDGGGHFEVTLPPGEYHIIFEKSTTDGRYFAHRDMALNIGEVPQELNINTVHQLRVEGTFLYHNDERNGSILFDSKEYSVSADITNGHFETYVLPGNYRIEVNMEGNNYYRFVQVLQASSFEMKDSMFKRVHGYVFNDVDGDGKYTGRDMGVEAKMTFATDYGLYNVSTAGTGYFSVRFYQDTYSVTINADGYQTFKGVHAYTTDDQYNYKLTPYPITLKGAVWFDSNHNNKMDGDEIMPHVPVTVTIKGSDIKYQKLTDANGNYSFTLVPGDYNLNAQYSTPGRNYSYATSVSIRAGDSDITRNLNLRLTYEVKGVVKDYVRNEPLPDTKVQFLDEHGNEIKTAKTGSDGKYSVFISEGDYTLYSHAAVGNRTLVHLERVTVVSPATIDVPLFYGVRLHGELYSGNLNHGVDIGRVDINAGKNTTLNDYTGSHGEYEFIVPIGSYHLSGNYLDHDATPNVKYILDTNVTADGHLNAVDYNIEVEKLVLYGFTWSVKSNSATAYIGYNAKDYRGGVFTFSVTNTGNESESIAFTYRFDNTTFWKDMNFDPADTVDLKAGETKLVNFTVKAADTSQPGRTAHIIINVTVTDENALSAEMPITLKAMAGKTGDAQVQSFTAPTGTIYEKENFTLKAELVNPVEFSKDIKVTVIFEHQTPSGQWEAIGKNTTTLTYGNAVTVGQKTNDSAGTHEYKVRIVPEKPSDDSNKENNEKTIIVIVHERPQKELTGWRGALDLGTNNSHVAGAMLIAISAVAGVSIGYGASTYKKKRRSRRYRRRHAKK